MAAVRVVSRTLLYRGRIISERMTLFLAQDVTWAPLRPDPDERIRPVAMRLGQALRKIRTGAICDAKTLIGIWMLAALRRGGRA